MSNAISSHDRLSQTSETTPDLASIYLSNSHQPVMDEVKSDLELQVVHAISGRVRIRTIGGSWNAKIEHLSQELKQQSWVLQIVENKNRGSLIFTFDDQQLPLHQILQLLTEFDVKYSPLPDKTNLAEIANPGFWEKQTHAIIPLIAGLLVTRGMRVTGFPAMIVYMIATDITRWLMNSIEPGLFLAVIAKAAAKLNFPEISLSGLTQVNKTPSSQTARLAKIDVPITYKIVHQISGRVRFHIPKLAQDPVYTQRLEQILKNDAAVSNFRVNIAATSLLINYHPSNINISYWVDLLQLPLSAEILHLESYTNLSQAAKINDLDVNIHDPNIHDTNINMNVSNLWTDLKPGMISYSLSVMANLPLASKV